MKPNQARRLIALRKKKAQKRGVALIMVLGAITVLTVFLTELQEDTSASLAAALADRDALKAEYYARSAVNLSRLLIASEPKIRGQIGPVIGLLTGGLPPQIPVWQFSDMILGPFNDQLGAAAFAGVSGLDLSAGKNLGLSGGGRFELKIIDEDSKINVNAAGREIMTQNRLAAQLLGLFIQPQYAPIFEGRDGDDQFSDGPTRCGAIIDWADSDPSAESQYICDPANTAAPTAASGEDNFYQTIGLDYVRKNAAYDSLEELRLVRGVDDVFWSTFIEPNPNDPTSRVMTVWGKPQINVNTAEPLALLGLICGNSSAQTPSEICINPEKAQSFIMGLSLVRQMLPGITPFPSKKSFTSALKGQGMLGAILASMGVTPINLGVTDKVLQDQIRVDSKVFSIYAEGVVPGYKKEMRLRIHAVVDFNAATNLGGTPSMGTIPTPAGTPAPSTPTDPSVAYLQALQTDPLGTVIYWRIE